MHPGKLEGHTAAARVYHALRSEPGRWWGGSELADAAGTTCVSTRISEVRHQLPAGERLEHRAEVFQFQRKQFYRIVVEGLASAPSHAGPVAGGPAAEATAGASQPSTLISGGGATTEAAASQPTPTATAEAAGSKIVRPAPGSLFAEGPAGHDGRKA